MRGKQSHPSLQALGRIPGARGRLWSALLVLALALAAFLHVAHSHPADARGIHQQHCAYCSTFDRGSAPPPVSLARLPAVAAPAFVIGAPPQPFAPATFHPACRPRAPPFLQA